MNNTTRFSNRVEDYVKYRPGYPSEIVTYLVNKWGLNADKHIADIGAGTGISAELFLKAGYKVTAVEPNKEMRDKSLDLLAYYPRFTAINGTAERTTLADKSVDAIIAGQAFHWFNREQSRKEFSRILKEGGLVVLIWNERKTESAFEFAYNELIIKHGIDYKTVDHRNIDEQHVGAFFSPATVQLALFANRQIFDYAGLLGRLLSSSYMPSREDKGYAIMAQELETLFDQYQENGTIAIEYDTKVYTGRLR